jgi:hypothetical protein
MSSVSIKATVKPHVFKYDLTSGISILDSLSEWYSYKYYVPVLYDQIIDIELAISNPSSTSDQKIIIYEYINRNSITESLNTTYSLSYNTTKKSYLKSYNITQTLLLI